MKKKKNEYKPQRYKKIIRNIVSIIGTLALGYVFLIVGYSVARPFGEIGEMKDENLTVMSEAYSEVQLEEIPVEEESQPLKAYWLKESDIESIEALESLVNVIGKEYNMVVVPLKIEGGRLNYSSSFEGAVLAQVGNDIKLSTIYDTIKSKGYTPAASINTMQDNMYPNASKNSGFVLNDTKKLWYDKQDQTGKPWLNPSSAETKQYLSAITGEIAQAGFKHIICTDVEYPLFSKEALEDIGGVAVEPDRYLDLVDNVNNMAATAGERGTELWLEISAYDFLNGSCEVFFKPIMLNAQKYVLEIDLNAFKDEMKIDGKTVDFSKMSVSEKIEVICSKVEESIYKSSFVPEISSSYLNMSDKKDVEKLFEKLGYDSYIIK